MYPFYQKTRPKGRQFQLVKFFAYTSLIVLIIFSFPLSMLISQKAKDALMKSHENYALLLGKNLNHQVFQNFVIPVIRRYGQIKLRDKNQSQWADRIVRNTIHSFNIETVNIYDIGKGVIAYSTDSRLIGKKVIKSMGYGKAVNGEYSSRLISESDDIWGLGIEETSKKKLRTFLPFKGELAYSRHKGDVLGVFELIQDLTKEYESIVRFQYIIIGLSILIMGLIFFALLLIVHKAERILAERAQEQQELERQLNQAERLAGLGQMCAGVSHEIRNPLGIISSTAELLSSMPDSNDSQKMLSGVIIEESSRLNNIVTEFLDFAHPQKPKLEDCNLGEILKKNLTFLSPELDKKGISVKDNLNGRNFRIKADSQLLYRGFLNIFINAIQSMRNGGQIDVTVLDKKPFYEVIILDTGYGIKKENLDKIYNPFFSTKDKGSGLGLSIVKNIVEAHMGTISIKSKDKSGTTIIIRLPYGHLEKLPFRQITVSLRK